MTRVRDLFDDEQEFDDLLGEANDNASTDWEMEFCADLIEKFEEYGADMFLSDAQFEKLKKIAGDA